MIYNGLTGLTLAFCLVDSRRGFESWWHSQFNMICQLAIIINFIIMTLSYAKLIKDSFYILTISNSSIFIVSLMVLISGKRHKEF